MSKHKLKIGMLVLLFSLPFGFTTADTIKDFVRAQLDGQGSVNTIDLGNRTIVVDDLIYTLDRTVTVFDTTTRKPTTLGNISVNDQIGFKSRALRQPTKPYDQLITKIWILQNN